MCRMPPVVHVEYGNPPPPAPPAATVGTAPLNATMQNGAPWAICITPGPTQYLYSADAYPGRIYKLTLDGKVLGVFGSMGRQPKQLGWVHEIACPSENEIYVAELLNWRVQKLLLHPSEVNLMRSLTLLLLSGSVLFAGTPATSTFYRDVLPILQERCQGCHRPGEVGPMAFGAYDETRPWAKAIKQVVLLGKMPPWYADAPPGKFHNDPRLSQQEIAKLVAWADTGAPAGNPKDAPRPTDLPRRLDHRQTRRIFQATAYQIPATGTLEYTYFIVPTGFKEDRWIAQAEVRPGNRAVVHHANVYIREPGSNWLREYPMGKLFVPEERGERVGTGGSSSAGASIREQVIAGFSPGRPAKQVPDGYAMLIPAGSDLVFQLHYTTNGKPTTDVTRIGFVFAKQTPTKRVIRVQASNAGFVIPPGADDYPVTGSAALGVDAELLNVYPAYASARKIDGPERRLSHRRARRVRPRAALRFQLATGLRTEPAAAFCPRARCSRPTPRSTIRPIIGPIRIRGPPFVGAIKAGTK